MLLASTCLVAAASATAMDWPDVQSVRSWPSLHELPNERPSLALHAPRRLQQPSLLELQRLKGGGASSSTATLGGALRSRSAATRRGRVALVAAVVSYPLIGLSFVALLALTLNSHPLWPPKLHSLPWCRSWLLTTVADYYGACFCLCGIILASEPVMPAVLWCAGCCLLGTPGCCAYVFSRLLRHGSLKLRDS